MRKSMTGHQLFNANQMKRSQDGRSVVIVESDADISIIGPHLNSEVVRCAPGFSKTTVLVAVRLHLDNADNWVFGVVDRDLGGGAEKNVVETSHYDLEAEIFFVHASLVSSYVFRHVVSEQLGYDEASRCVPTILKRSRNLAAVIGAMRHYAHANGLGISMAELPVAEIFRRDTAGDYVAATASLACQKAGKPTDQVAIESAALTMLSAGQGVDVFCNGHDLLAALRFLIQQESGHRANARDFARGLHGLVDREALKRLSIYSPLRRWLLNLEGTEVWTV